MKQSPAIARSQDALGEVLDDARDRLFALQNADGTWTGSIMYNAWTPGMYAILRRVMGLSEPAATLDWLEANRLGEDEHGALDATWGYIDTRSLHKYEPTFAAQIALEIWGRGSNERTWEYLNAESKRFMRPQATVIDPFTQLFAALASRFRPEGRPPYFEVQNILAPPIEAVLSPPLFKLSIPRFVGTWAQDSALGLMIALTAAKGADSTFSKRALMAMAEANLRRHQNSDGSWYGAILPTMSGVMALHQLGYATSHPALAKALAFLENLQRPDGYVERFHLPVWDTGLSVLGLRAAGAAPSDPRLQRAGRYLISAQEPVSGGVPYRKENPHWPDTDDASVACLALDAIAMGDGEREKRRTIRHALRWMVFMQSRDGGWGSFQKDQAPSVRGGLPFFLDDPPTADVTAHVMSALSLLERYGLNPSDKRAVIRGMQWFKRMQLEDGSWGGRWGLTYTYGTGSVLQAMHDLGLPMDGQSARRAGEYLLDAQRPDGGWGEAHAAYFRRGAQEHAAESTVDQTAWSMLGLMSLPPCDRTRAACERGARFLLERYSRTDGWPDDPYTVGAIWIYRNSNYAHAWPLWALGAYRRQLEES